MEVKNQKVIEDLKADKPRNLSHCPSVKPSGRLTSIEPIRCAIPGQRPMGSKS